MKHTSNKWKSVPSLGALFLLSRTAVLLLSRTAVFLPSRTALFLRSRTVALVLLFSAGLLAACKQSGSAQATTLGDPRASLSPKTTHPRLLELPATHKGEIIVRHAAFTLSYNTEHNTPNWVAWELTREETEGQGRRANQFLPDPDLDVRYQVTHQDYIGSGYDRGHMCPAGDNKCNAHAMTECFYLSNMCPQNHEFNSNSWERLENACRRWARKEGSVYIVCGPIYNPKRKLKTIGREHKISVPNGFFKCVLSLQPGKEKAIAFVYQHNEEYQSMKSVATSVDAVEELTGYNFFSSVPKELQNHVEAMCNLTEWD